MSFKEISAWIIFAAFAALFANYAWPLLEARSLDAGTHEKILGFVFAFVILVVVAHVILAIVAPKKANEAEDERDRRIELYAERAGGYALGAAALFGLVIALIEDDRLMANILFLGLVWSEIVKSAWQIILYRRGV